MMPDGVGNGTPLVYSYICPVRGGFLADNTGAFDLLHAAKCIRDAPMPRLELNRLAALVADLDRIAPEKIALFVRRPLRQEAGGHLDLDVAGDRPVHGADLWLVYRRTSELTVLATRNRLPAFKRL